MYHASTHVRRSILRFLLPLAALLLLGGCFTTGLFAPPYNAAVDEMVTAAHGEAAKITACIDLGLCADAASFDGYEEAYVTAFGQLKSAELMIGNLTVSRNSAAGLEARDLLLGQVQGCKMRLALLLEQHRASGVPKDAGFSQPVDVACDLALRATRAMK